MQPQMPDVKQLLGIVRRNAHDADMFLDMSSWNRPSLEALVAACQALADIVEAQQAEIDRLTDESQHHVHE